MKFARPLSCVGSRLQPMRWTLAVAALLIGTATPLRADEPGFALRFDGVSDYVRLAETALLMGPDWTTTKTVSLWVKPTGASFCSAPTPAHCDAIFGDRPRWWGISRGTVNGLDRIWLWNYDGGLQAIPIEYAVGEWVHVALVHGGGTLSAYRNGVLVGSLPSGATLQPNTGAFPVLHFGGVINNRNRNWTFEGEIDEVQLWDLALSAEQIAATMNTVLGPGEFGLAAYYGMSDGFGALLTDDSGHGWTGTLEDGGVGVPADGPILWVISGAFNGGGGGPGGNQPPVAVGQSLETAEDTALGIVLQGLDADGDPLTAQVTMLPAHGTLTGLVPNLTYTPDADYHGADSFSFLVNDGQANSIPATVSLTITPVNDSPVATADAAVTVVDVAVTVDVLANDSDIDGDPIVVTAVGTAANGAVVHDATSVTYLPDPGFTGTDSFSYTIADPAGEEAVGYVTVTVGPSGNPFLVGAYDTPGSATELAMAGTIAYVADTSGGLQIISIANPNQPVWLGSFTTPGGAHGVAVSGSYAYVANGRNGLRVINISDPAHPFAVATLDTPDFAQDVTVAGNLAYVSDRSAGLRIVDISAPASPVEIGSFVTPDQALAVAIDGTYAYVAAYGSGLRILDVSNPSQPVEVGVYSPPHLTYGVAVSGDLVYVAAGDKGLRLVDVTDPGAPWEVGAYDSPGFARSVAVSEGRAYLADWLSGLRVVDVSVPTSPLETGFYQTPDGKTRDVAVIGQHIYLADYEAGLKVLVH